MNYKKAHEKIARKIFEILADGGSIISLGETENIIGFNYTTIASGEKLKNYSVKFDLPAQEGDICLGWNDYDGPDNATVGVCTVTTGQATGIALKRDLRADSAVSYWDSYLVVARKEQIQKELKNV